MAGNDVRTFHRDPNARDNPHIAHARVDLKLAALAYDQSRHGIGHDLSRAGILLLCNAALAYARALLGLATSIAAKIDDGAGTGLELAALAYGQSRHGSDGGPSMARAGLGMLCQASIRYAEALLGRPIPHDPSLHLDDGM